VNDDHLVDELRRRAGQADVPNVLPAVRAAIDAPAPVHVRRWAALAGLAGGVAVLVLLVFALPRLSGPAAASATPLGIIAEPPSTISSLSAPAFAQLLRSGQLRGHTVVVQGEVVFDERLNGLYGNACRGSAIPGPKPDYTCAVGRLEGVGNPPVWIEADYVADRPLPDEFPGANLVNPYVWRGPAAPLTGALVFTIDERDGVKVLGAVPGDDWALTVGELDARDASQADLTSAYVVPAWLGGDVTPTPCPRPPTERFPELPDRRCGPWAWLSSTSTNGDMSLPPPGTVLVQSGAYRMFAPSPSVEDPAMWRAGLYVVAPRLEECSGDAALCRQWEVIGRITLNDAPSIAEPIATPPTPSSGPVTDSQTVGDFTLTISATQASYVAGDPIDVEATLRYDGDGTTVISSANSLLGFGLRQLDGSLQMGPGFRMSCRTWTIEPGQVESSQFVKSGGYDDTGPLADFWRSYFEDPALRLPAGAYELSVTTSLGGPDCTDIPAPSASIVITVGDDTAPATPTPVPIDPPAAPTDARPTFAAPVGCGYMVPATGETETVERMPVTIEDATGLVRDCITGWNRNPGPAVLLESAEADDLLLLSWIGNECDRSAKLVFRAVGTGFELAGTRDAGACATEVRYFADIKFVQPISVNDVDASVDGTPALRRDSPSPIADCAGAPAQPDAGSVVVDDHSAELFVVACSVTDGSGSDEQLVDATGDPTRITVEWPTECHNDLLDTRIGFWHREARGPAEPPSRVRAPFLLVVERVTRELASAQPCLEGPTGRTVVIDVYNKIREGDLEAVFVTEGHGVHTVEAAGHTFRLDVSASQSTHASGDAVDVTAALASDTDATIGCLFGPTIALERLDGSLSFEPGPFVRGCPPDRELRAGDPLTTGFLPAVWTLSDSNPLDPYIVGGQLFLPPGTYRFTASASFGPYELLASALRLEASVIVTVR
jgi:hypothetical protein